MHERVRGSVREPSRRIVSVPTLAACLTAALACATEGDLTPLPDPPAGLPYASAARSCAPWDGPATTILLTETPVDSAGPTPPYVSIGIWQGPEALPGTTVAWPGEEDLGAASRCSATDNCEAAARARVSFRRSTAAGALSGALDLEFPSGLTISGGFQVTVQPNPALCG